MLIEDAIKEVLEAIDEERSLYSGTEQAVCDHLVLPLLHTLGWSPYSIIPQMRGIDGRPDYTLRKEGRKKLLIEVKKLGSPFNSEIIRQLARYLVSEGVRYGLLTDGSRYVLYRTFQEGTRFEDNQIWAVDLELENDADAANRLTMISFDKIDDLEGESKRQQQRDNERQNLRNAMNDVWREMSEKKDDFIMVLIPVFQENLGTNHPDIQFKVGDIRDFVKEKINEMLDVKKQPTIIEKETPIIVPPPLDHIVGPPKPRIVSGEPPYIDKYRRQLRNPDTQISKMKSIILRERKITYDDLVRRLGEYEPTSGSMSACLRVLVVDRYVVVTGIGQNRVILANR